jgi:predicted nuclease of restriction endonuclease-like (RecB) superfamily
MRPTIRPSTDYINWLSDLKQRIQSAQQRATLSVNRELLLLYWQIGREIQERQQAQEWGAKVIEQLAKDLMAAFPNSKGFSRSTLMYMRAFHVAWPNEVIVQQLVGQFNLHNDLKEIA